MRKRDKEMLAKAVRRGVEYLDANPDMEPRFEQWFNRVEVNYLNMANGDYCIIGQTLGSYSDLVSVDDFINWSSDKLDRWAQQRGFLVRDRQHWVKDYWTGQSKGYQEVDRLWRDDAYAYLGALWREEVTVRQLAASAPLASVVLVATDPPEAP